jgi:2-amino-4-hydroxy-6-hydroxymethyldihydropteridine diphosphokinase
MSQVVLGLGGNIGDVIAVLTKSICAIENEIGEVKLKSNLYQTQAWGVEDQADFTNMVVLIETDKTPHEVLFRCLSIEKKLGRNRKGAKKWGERIIDIDVLFYDDKLVNTPDLILPHPHLHERNFVLFPLVDILPELRHPILNKTIAELKKETKDNQRVILLEDNI